MKKIILTTIVFLGLASTAHAGFFDFWKPWFTNTQLGASIFQVYQGGTGAATLTGCLEGNGTSAITGTGSACGSGSGGGSGGTWSTTTSQTSGTLINYPNNTTDVVVIGSNASTSAEWWYDPTTLLGYLKGKFGIGTTSPGTALGVTGAGVFTGKVTATNFDATSTTLQSDFAGSLRVGGNPGQSSTLEVKGRASETFTIGAVSNSSNNYFLGASDVSNSGLDATGSSYGVTGTCTGGSCAGVLGTGVRAVEMSVLAEGGYGIYENDNNNSVSYNYLLGNTSVGSTTSFAKLSVHAMPTDLVKKRVLFAIASSTAAYATSTFMTVDNKGLLTFINASSTAISVSGLTSGECVQASTGGLLTTTGSACGAGGGGGGVGWASTTPTKGVTNGSITSTVQVVSIGTSTPWFNSAQTIATSSGKHISFTSGSTTANSFNISLKEDVFRGSSLDFSTAPALTGATSTPILSIQATTSVIRLAVGTSTDASGKGPTNMYNNIASYHGGLFVGKKDGVTVAQSTSTFDGNIHAVGVIQTGYGSMYMDTTGIQSGDSTLSIRTTGSTIPGNVTFPSLGTDGTIGITGALCLSSGNGLIKLTGAGTCVVSSKRFKDDINKLNIRASDTLLDLVPSSFSMKSDPKGQLQYGLIAEEVDGIDKKLVLYGDDGLPFTVRYEGVTSLLVKGFQEQQEEINALKGGVGSKWGLLGLLGLLGLIPRRRK